MAERFLRMSHWVFDALMTVPMTKDEIRVMMLVVKYTVGFHRYECELSARFVANALNISYQHANKCINSLKAKGFISIIAPGHSHQPAKISFNHKKYYVAFQSNLRRISDKTSSHSEQKYVIPEATKKRKKEKKNITKEKEETLQATILSQSEPSEPEKELTPEEWWELHKGDE